MWSGLGLFSREILLNHFRKSNDSRKDIIEIMGNTAGKGTDGLHLLGLTELFFQSPLFGNIPGGGKHPENLARFIFINGCIIEHGA